MIGARAASAQAVVRLLRCGCEVSARRGCEVPAMHRGAPVPSPATSRRSSHVPCPREPAARPLKRTGDWALSSRRAVDAHRGWVRTDPLPVQADAPGRRPNELRDRVSAEGVRRLRPTRTNRPHVPSKEPSRAPNEPGGDAVRRSRRCAQTNPAARSNERSRGRPSDRDAPTGRASERTQRPGSSNDPTHARPLRPRRRHARTRRRTRRGRSSCRSRQPASAGARSPARPATSRFSHPAARSGVAERRSSSGRCRWHGSRRCQPGGPRRRRVPSDRRSRPGSAPAGPRTWWP
jgi:hypothetical protein